MKKRFASMLMAILTVFSLMSTTVLAADAPRADTMRAARINIKEGSTAYESFTKITPAYNPDSEQEDDYFSENVEAFISQNEVAHTVEFSEYDVSCAFNAVLTNNTTTFTGDISQKDLALAHNARATRKAKEYVLSLNLEANGYGYIEDFCLSELERYATMEDAQLLSYTVYTPKENECAFLKGANLKSSNYNYFGSYNGRDFYFFYPSSAVINSNIQKQSTKAKLQKWVNNIISCTLQFKNIEVNAAWSVFQFMMGAPANYIVHDSAFTESYCNLRTYTRGIYTIGGQNSYQMQTSQQFCNVYPYIAFHPVDPLNYDPIYPHDFGYQGVVYSPKFNKSTTELCQEAWQVFYGTYSLDKYDTINTSAFKTFWR